MPAREVNDTKVAESPGKITKMIHKAYKKKVTEYIRKNSPLFQSGRLDMNKKINIAKLIDHTLLRPDATETEN